ncbi:hypothetical protein TanjilG_05154 [Lupinus angustifolius]|uniref:XS domain-containing protein n=1 Tax=Lupinus angustifolius TaxID=3871 RepID=A0A394DED6_LUPAN|nr:PREDICTED: uncharacterized protein LOC109340078 [Lupinus angustifolius]OIW21505.1 hypothetical protein TanjilG_05154 [Lupinus angustifolius]
MQFRRREEERVPAALSPSSKLRAQHRLEADPDLNRRNIRDGLDPVQQRNLSPLKMDGVRRGGGAVGNKVVGRSDGFKRRDFDWQLGGRRSGRFRLQSPVDEQLRKRTHFNDGVMHRSCSPPPMGLRPRHEMANSMDYEVDDDEHLDVKHTYINREKGLIENRLGGGVGMVDHKYVIRGNEAGGSYMSNPDSSIPDMGVNVTSRYEEAGGHLPRPSRTVPMGRFDHGRLQHQESLSMDKIPITETHTGVEKVIYHATDGSYATISPSYMNDFAGTSHLRERDYGGSSVEMSRSDFLCSRGDGICLPTPYDLSRSGRKLAEPAGFSEHEQRPAVDTTRDPEIRHRNMMCHQRCEFSPTRSERGVYLNSKLQVREAQDDRLYQYDDLPRRIASHGRLRYEKVPMEYDNKETSSPYISYPDVDRTATSGNSYGNQRKGVIRDHPALQKPKYFDYQDMRRTSMASTQDEAYLHSGYSHLEGGKRVPQDYEISYMRAPEADRSSNLRSHYESRRDGGPGLQQERFQSSSLSKHNSEAYRQAARVQEMKQDIGIHDHSGRFMKRKYYANEDIEVCDSRAIKSSKWDATEEFQDAYENEEWVDDEDMNMLYSTRDTEFNHKTHEKYKREYNGMQSEEDFPSDEWILPQDSVGHVQKHSLRFQKYPNHNIKHHSKPSSSSWYKPQHFSKRNVIHKQPKVWKKHHSYHENKHTSNDESSEDWVSATESEPPEGSEEFKRMVHEAFLMYSKNLNLSSSLQKRYQEQGKAGSLYCSVCGRSSSKEFMDTQCLVTHAFMSHKAGLRAKHMGLHKAVCVMMGWDTIIPQDTVTWVPRVLPHAEALAQKDDLIIWTPIVIIHNISMHDDNPQNWKVVSMETIEAFLRGKGFVRGRIKLCLGKPADQSVILVKFLGTFVGLADAEKLHQYLSDNNRGRAEYEKVKSKGIESCDIKEANQIDKVENILYGYVGIAEDFDKLDFNSKKWSSIKSRKEIDDLDKAPVKTDEKR